jgi:hypothetical protein
VQPLVRRAKAKYQWLGVVVTVVRLEGPLEMVDNLVWTDSRAAHQAEVGMPVQPSREVPVTMTGDHWS